MAVPKKRTGHSAQGSRRSNWKATKPETTKCPNCGETVLAHTVCTACGTYKGQPVKLADKAAAAAATAPAKKTAKKSTKKAAKSEETKVEEVKTEEVSTEEVKAEAEVEKTEE
ncbi:MAG: 50S ribosomal protein L32 [Candidatus Gastranaerophilaceae bacterium]